MTDTKKEDKFLEDQAAAVKMAGELHKEEDSHSICDDSFDLCVQLWMFAENYGEN